MFISTCETIFSFIIDLLFDLSIKHEYPIILAFAFVTSFEHSKLDFPVVITSSTIKTFEPSFIIKSLLSENSPFILSEKIVSTPNNLPISYPIIIPPIAGESIKSILVKEDLIFSAKD